MKANIEANPIATPSLKALAFNNLTLLFKRIPYIHYMVWFKKNQAKIRTFTDFGSENNAMTLAYIAKLGFKI